MFSLIFNFINPKSQDQILFLGFTLLNLQYVCQFIVSDIVEKVKQKEEQLIYELMKKELLESFSDFRYLARGNQGYVILAKEKQTNKRFAIKGYYVRNEQGKVEEVEEFNDAIKEIEILSQCRGSPYVSNLIKSIDLEQNQFLYLVFTEYQGTLQEVIDSTQNKRLNEISAIKYSKDIAEGLLYIHNKGYLVNDLKMDNILIDYNGNAVVSKIHIYQKKIAFKLITKLKQIGDFGYAQKVKKNSGYAYYEYQGNIYFQAPECVDQEVVKLYEDEYKKIGVVTQMNPSQRSEACSFGYLIYTMIQGKKQAYNFMYEKHKPLVYDNDFKSFKYSNQLQYIIDGLTKFIPRERISISEAFEQLQAIIPVELNLDQKFQIQVSEQTQKLTQNELNEIEFIQTFEKKYIPIVKNEDSFLKELIFENNFSNELLEKLEQLQNQNESLQQDKENLKKTLRERENQLQEIQEVQVASQINIQKQEKEIMDLKEKLQTKCQEVEDLKNSLQNLQNQHFSLQQKQDSLQVDFDKKLEYHPQTKKQKIEKQTQKECFLVNQDKELNEIEEQKEQIREYQEAEKKNNQKSQGLCIIIFS